MGRYLIVTWDGAGNLVSTLGIARGSAQPHRIEPRVTALAWT